MVESVKATLQNQFKELRTVKLTMPTTYYTLLDAMEQIGATSALETIMRRDRPPILHQTTSPTG